MSGHRTLRRSWPDIRNQIARKALPRTRGSVHNSPAPRRSRVPPPEAHLSSRHQAWQHHNRQKKLNNQVDWFWLCRTHLRKDDQDGGHSNVYGPRSDQSERRLRREGRFVVGRGCRLLDAGVGLSLWTWRNHQKVDWGWWLYQGRFGQSVEGRPWFHR